MLNKFLAFFGNHLYITAVLAVLFIGSMCLLGWYETKTITELNQPVEVRILEHSRIGKRNYFIKIYHQGKSFSKRTSTQNFRQLKNSKTVVMLTNKEQDQFIFPDELKKDDGLGGGIIFISFALFLMFRGYRSLNN